MNWKSIEEENPFDEYAENRINEYVNATLDCDVDVIKNVIVSFTEYNEKYGHKYSRQLSVLVQGYTDKLNGKEAKKIAFHFNSPIGTMVAHADEIKLKQE